jgi:RNA polymerase sigma factor (sigma-70 family)
MTGAAGSLGPRPVRNIRKKGNRRAAIRQYQEMGNARGAKLMASGQAGPVLRFLRKIVVTASGGESTDRQLLERFVRDRDANAFAGLVQRHGPMVLGVCRRVLRNADDAEDAFQATFLVLVHKARAIGRPDRLGNWLYGVAYRTALRARSYAARRRIQEERVIQMPAADPALEVAAKDLRQALDRELAGLSEKYRLPLVLCYLEGMSTDEVASQLGCARGTVLSRLARGRERLRRRLVRRGLVLSVALFAAALADSTAPAALQAALAESTIKAAVVTAAGQATAAGAVSAHVVALTKGVVRSMLWTKLKIAGVVLIAVTMAGGTAVVLTHRALADKPAGKEADGKTDKEKLQGRWKLVSGEMGGKPAEDLKEGTFLFKGDKFITERPDGMTYSSDYTIDPTKKPKSIDITPREAPESEKDKTIPGIYELDGDTLRICANMPDLERPTELKSKEGTRIMLLTFKRAAKDDK